MHDVYLWGLSYLSFNMGISKNETRIDRSQINDNKRHTFNAASAHKTKRSDETASSLSSEDCLSFFNFLKASDNADRSLSWVAPWTSFRILLSIFVLEVFFICATIWGYPFYFWISLHLVHHLGFSKHSHYGNEKRGTFDSHHVM